MPFRIWGALWRLSVGGLACAAATALIGFALERVRFGSSEIAAFDRVQDSVRAEISGVAASLREIATSLARENALLAAAATDPAAARTLLDRADDTLQSRPDAALAVTAYGPAGPALAWSGRPSELPVDRVTGPEALFVAPGPLGLRLVYVQPVVDPARGRRLGAIAAERVLSPSQGVGTPPADAVLLSNAVVPVSVRARYEGAGEVGGAYGFVISSPSGEPLLEAHVSPEALSDARQHWRRGVANVVWVVLAATLILWIGPLLAWRAQARTRQQYFSVVAAIVVVLVAARALLWFATTSEWTEQIIRAQALSRFFRPILRTPADFLLTALLLGGLVMLTAHALEQYRRAARTSHHAVGPRAASWIQFGLAQSLAGLAVAAILVAYQRFLNATLASTSVDVLHFSIHPWNAARLSLSFGLVLLHAVVIWTAILIFIWTSLPWRIGRRDVAAFVATVLRALPLAAVIGFNLFASGALPIGPTVLAGLACVLLAALAGWARPRYRHASQAFRLVSCTLVLLMPALVMYPSVLRFADRAKRQLIETRFAPEALSQASELQVKLSEALAQIDKIASLPELVVASPQQPVPTAAAFFVWSQTTLAVTRLTSAVELYGSDGSLVSRFALNLPEDTTTAQWTAQGCNWDLFGEASPFGSEDRRLLHAGRAVCRPRGSTAAGAESSMETIGGIVVHVMLDYSALPFISSKSPYYELVRASTPLQQEGIAGRDLEFVAYGWGRRPIYASSDTAWALDEVLLDRVASSRKPFWTTLTRGDRRYATYVLNDRAGVYVLGFPLITELDHLINLAELTTLAAVGYVMLVLAASLFALLGGGPSASGRALLREVRASFYRKLFLAFVAASVVPVVILAFATRTFFAAQLRASIESEAVRTTAVAQRVIEEYVAQQQRGTSGAPIPDDNVMVLVSRAINQDVNIFDGPQLLTTSERDLFASGLLPLRTPSPIYRAIALDRLASFVGDELAGDFQYMLAAAPVRVGDREAILTVPLALRQQEIEREIDDLDRRVLLAALLFVLLGAGIGYSMAERIGDPVNRLTRATRRIARGDLTARIAQTSSDELRRLVEDFNRMAADLQKQRVDLERTHRLEAWADMARQVAHEIKNPLTPIQLSAEHLVRVHKDRGEPLAPALEECVGTILSQVKLLRQISAEFSNFASSPTPHPSPTSLAELVATVVEPYRTGLGTRIAIRIEVPVTLPVLSLDRTLLARALTNIIENSLHAMPGGGTLTIAAAPTDARAVRLSIADTGAGMDQEALRRIFEPYFSTKATGTGLGLTIAKRNVELNGGTISVQSRKGAGTVVAIELPVHAAVATLEGHPSTSSG